MATVVTSGRHRPTLGPAQDSTREAAELFVYQAYPDQEQNPYEFPTYERTRDGLYVFSRDLIYRPEELDFTIRYV